MPPEVHFRLKMSLRMSVCEWDGVSDVVSTPFFYFESCVKREYVLSLERKLFISFAVFAVLLNILLLTVLVIS